MYSAISVLYLSDAPYANCQGTDTASDMLLSLVRQYNRQAETDCENRWLDELEGVVLRTCLAADGERPFWHHFLVGQPPSH